MKHPPEKLLVPLGCRGFEAGSALFDGAHSADATPGPDHSEEPLGI